MNVLEGINQYQKEDWWFFDTNCLSELVKQYNAGHCRRVSRFIKDKCVLILITNLVELHKVQNLLPEVPTALASAKLIGVATDTHPFVKRELFKYLRLDRATPNVLNLFELTDEFATKLVSYQPFLDAVAQSEREIEEKFVAK